MREAGVNERQHHSNRRQHRGEQRGQPALPGGVPNIDANARVPPVSTQRDRRSDADEPHALGLALQPHIQRLVAQIHIAFAVDQHGSCVDHDVARVRDAVANVELRHAAADVDLALIMGEEKPEAAHHVYAGEFGQRLAHFARRRHQRHCAARVSRCFTHRAPAPDKTRGPAASR
jgi:hypothetical protein